MSLFLSLESPVCILYLFLTVSVNQEHDFRGEKDKAQARDQSPFDEEKPFHVIHDTSRHSRPKGNFPAEQCNTAEEAIPTEEPYVAASEGVFPPDAMRKDW